MAKEPQDMVLSILREIQAKLAEHDRQFEQIGERFQQVESRFDFVDGRFDAQRQHFDSRLDRVQDQVNAGFDAIDRKISDRVESTAKGIGLASYANTRHESVQRPIVEMEMELGELRTRLSRLEEKV